ncbi:Lariat debranching enzyme B [Vanrija pseudolonga]|uniref:Lariat debranching enzyme B n=1 Tax=Vanrija pseudolonga TaxID=143232 RepID=A0AAF1BIM1_9TREE|nr:Lariat debranching enzyme B [Vanrija pseudolonga]
MLVAVQGCSHGSLTAIYDTVAQFEARKGQKVKLLLLCGDFQALRSRHDFASLAVPVKYQTLGTFHEYYAGTRVAPVLTIVIGGNHEASNYMWELYHGGWLAPNIYYLGTAGSVLVDGLRISGASGIFKEHDYRKGHFERMPLTGSQVRSKYHIRQYDVAKLMQLPRSNSSIFLSHDWPISIPHYGNTQALLSRKPFFRSEVEKNTLGSPPLLTLLDHIQPAFWFSAHLHVKFAALYEHPVSDDTVQRKPTVPVAPQIIDSNPDEISITDDEEEAVLAEVAADTGNPDEITLSDDDFDEPAGEQTSAPAEVAAPVEAPAAPEAAANGNPEEILVEDEEFDEEPHAPPPAPADGPSVPQTFEPALQRVEPKVGPHGGPVTQFLALDKCGAGKEFIQFLDIPSPEMSPEDQPPRLTFDLDWLAITRALHGYMSTEYDQAPLPDAPILDAMIDDEIQRIRQEGLLVPAPLSEENLAHGAVPPLVWERGPVDVGRVQQFWPTAPPEGQPGGSASAWYTNPQTEAFCGMLGIDNKVNPRPQ